MDSEDKVVCAGLVLILNAVLTSKYDKLRQVLDGSMPDIANKMLEKGLISEPVKKTGTFDAIIQSFRSGCGFITDTTTLDKYVSDFFYVLQNVGGPPAMAGLTLEAELKESVEKEFPYLSFLVRRKPMKSTSVPENANFVSIKPKLNRSAYSESHTLPSSMEHSEPITLEYNTSPAVSRQSNTDTPGIYFQAREEEDFKKDGGPDASELASTRPNTLTDPNNPVISGKTSNNAIKSPASSSPILKDSGMPPTSKLNLLNGSLATSGQPHLSNYQQPIADTYNPSEPVSDKSEARNNLLSSRSMSSFSESSMANEYIDHLKEELKEKELKGVQYERKKKEEAEKKYCESLESQVQQLREELQNVRKELQDVREENASEKQKLQLEKAEFSQEKKDLKVVEDRLLRHKEEFVQKEIYLKSELENIRLNKDTIKLESDKLIQKKESLKELNKEAIKVERDHVTRERRKIDKDRKHHKQVEEELKQLKLKLNDQQREQTTLRKEQDKLEKDRLELRKAQDEFREKEDEIKLKREDITKQGKEMKVREQTITVRERRLNEREAEQLQQCKVNIERENSLKEKETEHSRQCESVKQREDEITRRERHVGEMRTKTRRESQHVRQEQKAYHQWLSQYRGFLVAFGVILLFYTFVLIYLL